MVAEVFGLDNGRLNTLQKVVGHVFLAPRCKENTRKWTKKSEGKEEDPLELQKVSTCNSAQKGTGGQGFRGRIWCVVALGMVHISPSETLSLLSNIKVKFANEHNIFWNNLAPIEHRNMAFYYPYFSSSCFRAVLPRIHRPFTKPASISRRLWTHPPPTPGPF